MEMAWLEEAFEGTEYNFHPPYQNPGMGSFRFQVLFFCNLAFFEHDIFTMEYRSR